MRAKFRERSGRSDARATARGYRRRPRRRGGSRVPEPGPATCPASPCVGGAVRTTRCWPWWRAPRRRLPAWRSCGSGRTCPDVTRTAPLSSPSSDLLPVLLSPPWVPLRRGPHHGDMHGNAFRTSRSDRRRRRADGPALTLVADPAVDAPAPSRVVARSHPAFEGFTPDGIPGDRTRSAVHRSGPGSPSVRRPSRGSASPDVGAAAHSGPGPHVPQAELVRRIADHLAAFDARRAAPDAAVVRLRGRRVAES